jgi:hypothetical protein
MKKRKVKEVLGLVWHKEKVKGVNMVEVLCIQVRKWDKETY